MRVVQYSLKQLIVSVLQQLIEVWHVRWAEAAEKCVYALAVRRRDEPSPRGDAYVSRDTTSLAEVVSVNSFSTKPAKRLA